MKFSAILSLNTLSLLLGFSAAAEYKLYDFDTSITTQTIADLEQKTGNQNSPETLQKPYVVMVSLDGFRWDYPELHNATNLKAMKSEGSYVKRLIPSFPSKTFPNHYTLATGLYPSHHGLIGNTFYSKEKQAKYSLGDRSVVEDGSWYGGTPLWVLAEKQGMLAASFFWVGSEAAVQNVRPSYSFKYNSKIPYDLRAEKVENWLQLPEAERPHMIFLYYSLTDSAGHAYGPEAPETGEAVRYVDAIIGKLRDYIHHSNLPINLIVTADHGMTEINNSLNVEDYTELRENRFVSGPMAMIYTDSESETERLYVDLQKSDKFQVYRQGALPAYLNFKNEDRIGDLVLVTDPPKVLLHWNKDEEPKTYKALGTHGYDPFRNEDMSAIFIAEGPNIRKGMALSPVENIHVYPFIADILGLKITDPIDGEHEKLAPLLKE